MNHPRTSVSSSLLRIAVASCSALAPLLLPAIPAEAQRGAGQQQERRVSDPPILRRNLRNVLNAHTPAEGAGRVPMTAADSMHQRIVQRLDFDSYKELVRGLTRFGDREQGTARNAAAIDWIEAQLRSWGYETERVHYMFSNTRGLRPGQPAPEPEPREEVFATKIGADPSRMYILGDG